MCMYFHLLYKPEKDTLVLQYTGSNDFTIEICYSTNILVSYKRYTFKSNITYTTKSENQGQSSLLTREKCNESKYFKQNPQKPTAFVTNWCYFRDTLFSMDRKISNILNKDQSQKHICNK